MKKTAYSRIRLVVLGLCFGAVLLLFTLRLAQIQIVRGSDYLAAQQSGDTKVQTVRAARGEIVDRDGSPFAYNESSYSIVLDKALMPLGDENKTIEALLEVLTRQNESRLDRLPLERDENGVITFTEGADTAVASLKALVDINTYASAPEVFYWLCERYGLEDYPEDKAFAIASVRYDMERTGYSLENRYTLAGEVSLDTAVIVSQLRSKLPGADVEEVAKRVYVDGDLAPHIIGRTGAIVADQAEAYLAKGYSLSDRVGVEGIERAYEDVLRGENGERLISRDAAYNITGVTESKPAVPGDTVMLTIDKDIQRAAMDALAAQIKNLNETAPEGEGREADAGAVVAIDIKKSEVLAAVTYPSYDLSTYAEDFAENSANPINPFWNRALAGVYAPGSTFKPVVALAGMTEGIISPLTRVNCERVYDFFADYQPTCLGHHGPMTAADAIRVSCNVFFYDTGRQLGIDIINSYATSFGLGAKTGIELYEAAGTQCDPDTPNPGDVLQASIGQLDNGYTPIQLANYAATIARRGIRTELSLVKSISSYYDYDNVIDEAPPAIEAVVTAPEEYWDAVFKGMIDATHSPFGTSYRYLGDYPLTVASKTGTPQTQAFPNSTYICFAPAEDPQIAIAVVIEKGWHGYTGAPVARAVFDAYFYPDGAPVTEGAGEEAPLPASETAPDEQQGQNE